MSVEQVIKWKSSRGGVFDTREEAVRHDIETRLSGVTEGYEDQALCERNPMRWIAMHAEKIRDIINEELGV